MSSVPTAADIANDAHWLLQAFDHQAGLARFVAMTAEEYRAEAFLDDRMLTEPRDAHVIPWTAAAEAGALIGRRDARWIFHIGHVGSTLISRLLGEIDGVLSIREPRSLRDLALLQPADRDHYAEATTTLMSRTFDADEIACIKATSFVSEIAPIIVPPGQRSLFLYASPRNYVASILAGENNVKELQALAQSRANRLSRRVSAAFPLPTDAHRAAAAWACEMTALEAATEAMPDRQVNWVDFDDFLADPVASLGVIGRNFGFIANESRLSQIVATPIMRSYSKAPQFGFTTDVRRALITQSNRQHSGDIASALAMLHDAARDAPLLARALERARGA